MGIYLAGLGIGWVQEGTGDELGGVRTNNSFEWTCYKMHREMGRCLKEDCWSQEVFVLFF